MSNVRWRPGADGPALANRIWQATVAAESNTVGRVIYPRGAYPADRAAALSGVPL
jgi:hypothetical protein